MATMQAVVVDPNAPQKLVLKGVDAPSPAPNEALVRVAATSLNLGEVRRAMSADAGHRPGWDVAGTVAQAAADGSGPAAGARVVGFVASGAWAEQVAVSTAALAELPDGVSFVQAATLPVAGLTALYAVEKATGLIARPALITGASGGVGHFGCQLARLAGAEAFGLIRRPEHVPFVESLGAQAVLSDDGSGAGDHGPYRLVVETVGGKVLTNVLGMLAPDGVCVMIGASAGSEVAWSVWPFIGTGRAHIYGFTLFNEIGCNPAGTGLCRLAKLVADGRLKTHISMEAPWGEVGRAARDLLDRHVEGKAVLHIGP